MGRWGDDIDPEVKEKVDPKGRFTLNFKKMITDVGEIIESTTRVDDRHPKVELLKEWAGAMTGFFILFLFSYQILCFITVLFMAFYLYGVIKIGSAWKHFKYKVSLYVLMNVGALGALFAIAYLIRTAIMG